MKYVVLEDEPLAAEKLVNAVTEARPHWEHLATLQSLSEARASLAQLPAQLVFVDIHLADGLSFELFEQQFRQLPLIFTTAYDQYALRAFELNSVDYLLKPIRQDKLERALGKWEQRQSAGATDWQKLVRDMQHRYKSRFLVSTGERIRSVPVGQIAYFFAQGKNCFLCDAAGRQHLLDQSLQQLGERLDPRHFFQINRQYILNIDYISEMIPWSKSRLKVVMKPATPEPAIVSVERSPRFKMWIAGEGEIG